MLPKKIKNPPDFSQWKLTKKELIYFDDKKKQFLEYKRKIQRKKHLLFVAIKSSYQECNSSLLGESWDILAKGERVKFWSVSDNGPDTARGLFSVFYLKRWCTFSSETYVCKIVILRRRFVRTLVFQGDVSYPLIEFTVYK